MNIKNVGIIGLGLIGGSIAKALKAKNKDIFITAYNNNLEVLEKAKEESIINCYTKEIDNHFFQCEIIIIATPINSICDTCIKLKPLINENCIITDVGSTKETVYNKISAIDGINYIGGHPMAGSEKSGYFASKSYLLENAYYILCPKENTDSYYVEKMESFVRLIGAIPIVTKPNDHDYAVAAISHIPHVIASALVNTVKTADENSGLMHTLAAGGFKDLTRIASSDPNMWTLISKDNKQHILSLLDRVSHEISCYKESLENDDYEKLESFFTQGKKYRDTFISGKSTGGYVKDYSLHVDIEDKTGAFSKISTLLSENHINIKNIGIVNNREYDNGIMEVHFSTEESRECAYDILNKMNYTVFMNKS